jgi:hypothetical protein
MRNDLTADFLRSILDYAPDTGVLSWCADLNRPGRAFGLAGTISRSGYIQIGINNKLYLGHRIAWLHFHGKWPKQFLDHANGNRTDNRIVNLREASRADNNRNRALSAHNSSGFKGVVVRPDGRISARIGMDGKQIHLGYFASLQDANSAYEAEAKRIFGEFFRPQLAIEIAPEIVESK